MARYIFTDIDGCLTSEASVSVSFDESFHRFVKLCRDASAGHGPIPPITLCTGRPQPYVEAMMKLLDIRIPAICENGAVIYTLADNRARYAPGVTAERVLELMELRAYIERELLPKAPGVHVQFGKSAQLSLFSADPERLEPLIEPIDAFVSQRPTLQLDIQPSHYYLNISLAGVSKGRAVEWVMNELGVRREEVVGIGDTVGDMPLRDAVSYFGCPANSHDVIKAAADYVSPFPLLAGVLDILEQPPFHK